MQVKKLQKDFRKLHTIHGDRNLESIFGCGCTTRPRAMFIFMNPTRKNVAAEKRWSGIRAPWLGAKNIWRLFRETNFISEKTYATIRVMRPKDWTPVFSRKLYQEIAKNGGYITNLAKCTQVDARPLPNAIFKKYGALMYQEILAIHPKIIFTFGNQVSSILLEKPISVGKITEKPILLKIQKKSFAVFPVHYPVGQGMRNLPRAIRKINLILQK